MKNLWILTEERPKREVLEVILAKFAKDSGFPAFIIGKPLILPILDKGHFAFTYEVHGFTSNKVNNIFVKTVSGKTSFVDFLVFYQDNEPTVKDTPLYAIEETKTDDSESRNTGVYQRITKFVIVDNYFPTARKIMLYNLQIEQKETPTPTNIFGTRLLLTLGVEILGKQLDKTLTKFSTVDEVVAAKNAISPPPKGNVPIVLIKKSDGIKVSGRLIKSGNLAHDPNIGALSAICAVLRKLGYKKPIIITKHGLQQQHLTTGNKFVIIANKLNISFECLKCPNAPLPADYWHYETEGEKIGTIFIHTVVENFAHGNSIFENHAGCEKGYFITGDGEHIPLEKYTDREKYKQGDKSAIINIPDLILVDLVRKEIINVEGKKYQFRQNGIDELALYDAVENLYIKKYYPKYTITRSIVLYGGHEQEIVEIQVGFLLNEDGDLVLGIKAPPLFRDAIKSLLDYWR